MIDVSDKNSTSNLLLLEVAFQAERVVALVQHSLVDRAMRRMTDYATFAHSLVFENKWTALR